MKEKKTPDIRFSSLGDILQILGIIESNGCYFLLEQANRQGQMVSSNQLADVLFHFSNERELEKTDWGRTIRNAKNIYNLWDKDFQILGDKRGSYFVKKKNLEISPPDLKTSQVYRLFLIFSLAFATLDGNLNWDVLHQLLNQRFPLALITFLNTAIKYKFILEIHYKQDRTGKKQTFEAVPIKIVCKDSHWLLVIYDLKQKTWIHLLMHSILEIFPKLDNIRQIRTSPNLPDFNVEKFYSNTFSIAKLEGQQPIEFVIRVPNENKEAIQKRRKEGKWENKSDYWLWKVHTYDPDEVFSYVFRWNGILKILEPKVMIEEYKKKLKQQLKQYLKLEKL